MKLSERKIEIITIAAKLFKEKGYSAVTMRDIAQAMDIKAASLYNHIKSKQEILTSICLDYMEELLVGVEGVHNLRRTAHAQLVKFLEFYTQFQIDHWNATYLIQYEYKHMNLKNQEHFKQLRKSFENYLVQIIKKGIRSKRFCQIDPEIIVNIILSSMKWRHNSPKKLQKAFEENQNELFHILFKGIENNTKRNLIKG